jgi:hypothetical protein
LLHGGEGRVARDQYTNLSDTDQRAIVTFLKTLRIVPQGQGQREGRGGRKHRDHGHGIRK